MNTLIVIAWLLFALAIAMATVWLIVIFRVRRVTRARPTVRAGLTLPVPGAAPGASTPRVSIIIPAHNEQRVIDACAKSLRAQRYESLEIIFVLDRCTDDTLEIMRRHATEDDRIVILENSNCPPDWAGKCNAARVGADCATGDYLLFTDADTAFDPDLVRAAVAMSIDRNLGLLSLLSTLTFQHAHERIAQPVATMKLIAMYPIDRVNRSSDARPFANGQFLLFSRSAYENVGGHAGVKEALLEDIAFANKVYENGDHAGLLLADGMLMCSMYDSLSAFVLGWKRIYIEACRRKPRRLRKNAARVLALGVIAPLAQVVALALGVILLFLGETPLGVVLLATTTAALGIQAGALRFTFSLGRAPWISVFLYPVGCWIVSRIMLEGARDLVRRRPIPWAGRQYVLEPRY